MKKLMLYRNYKSITLNININSSQFKLKDFINYLIKIKLKINDKFDQTTYLIRVHLEGEEVRT